jgi:hypothetical protein
LLSLVGPLALEGCSAKSRDGESSGDGGGGAAGDATTASSDGAPAQAGAEGGDDGAPNPCDPVKIPPPPDSGVDAHSLCEAFYTLSCGVPNGIAARTNCYFLLDDCNGLCGDENFIFNCHAYGDGCVGGSVTDGGPVVIDCATCPGAAGRKPAGLEEPAFERGAGAFADYFARVAHLEAASVHAFRGLRRDLERFGAPSSLARAARRAEQDERRHARVMARFARRFGGNAPRARVRSARARSLEEVAHENGVEGCVRETYAALIATWQAARATDPEIAREMAAIAEDETRHAALAWAFARWAEEHLDDSARARLRTARDAAVAEIEQGIAPVAPTLACAAGLPSPDDQRRLLGAVRRELWPRHVRKSNHHTM